MTRRKVRQVVTLPYNLLLHRDARDALGIDLTNQIVVVDEAHSKHFAKRGYNLSYKDSRLNKILYRLCYRYPPSHSRCVPWKFAWNNLRRISHDSRID
jgi:Rad3-related DNA helicase